MLVLLFTRAREFLKKIGLGDKIITRTYTDYCSSAHPALISDPHGIIKWLLV
jgi:hypothetical protein